MPPAPGISAACTSAREKPASSPTSSSGSAPPSVSARSGRSGPPAATSARCREVSSRSVVPTRMRATRSPTSGGIPIQASTPSGPVASAWNHAPGMSPVTLRTISPVSQPCVMAW